VHIQCTFPDGTCTQYQLRQTWAFDAEAIPHAQSSTPLDAALDDIDARGTRHDVVGATNLDCGQYASLIRAGPPRERRTKKRRNRSSAFFVGGA